MATQTLEFTYPSGQNITARLINYGGNTEVAAAVACTELPNRIERYQVVFSGISGDVQIVVANGGTEAAGDFYTLQDVTSATYYPWAEMPPTAASGDADGGNYYALNNTVRDGLTASPGWITGDQLVCEDPTTPGTYIWLTEYAGPWSGTAEGTTHQFIPSSVSDGTAYYAADTAALDVITNLGMKPGDTTILANVGIHVWKATYTGDFSGAVDGQEYDFQPMVALDGGSYYAADNAARDALFLGGLVAGDLIYLASSGSEGSYIMLLDWPAGQPYANAEAGTDYQFIISSVVPPTGDIQQAINTVAY